MLLNVVISFQEADGYGFMCRVLKDFDQIDKDGKAKSSPEVVKLVAEKKKALVIFLLLGFDIEEKDIVMATVGKSV